MKYFFILLLVLVSGCAHNAHNVDTTPPFIQLGSVNSSHIWIYLCGLSRDIDSEYNNHQLLNRIGKNLNITFLAITPRHRCPEFDNMLCWPGGNTGDENEVLNTYQEITDVIGERSIDGYIGFSNGGYFLNYLAQYKELKKPIIVVGAGLRLLLNHYKDYVLYILIGKKDYYHYDYAKKFYADAQRLGIKVSLFEFDDGHVIPEALLENVLKSLMATK